MIRTTIAPPVPQPARCAGRDPSGRGDRRRTWIRRLDRAGIPVLLFTLLYALLCAGALRAEETPPAAPAKGGERAVLQVGIYESPPFVMGDTGGDMGGGDTAKSDTGKGDTGGGGNAPAPTGMAIDLWDYLAKAEGIDFEYLSFDTYRDLVDAISSGGIDVAVSNLTITRARAERADFTQPWFDGGMRIMVPSTSDTSFLGFVTALREAGHLRLYLWIAGSILFGSVALTIFDRRFNPGFPARWRDGFAESFYNVMSLATTGKMPSRAHLFGWLGRIWQALWLVCGVAILAYATSSITSVMTTLALTGQINSLADLPGRSVGVLSGSVAEPLARAEGMRVRTYARIGEAAEALRAGEIDAVVADAPVLEYHAFSHPEAGLRVVGPRFEPDKYGFALPRGDDLTKRLTLQILDAQESGKLEALRETYFGPAE